MHPDINCRKVDFVTPLKELQQAGQLESLDGLLFHLDRQVMSSIRLLPLLLLGGYHIAAPLASAPPGLGTADRPPGTRCPAAAPSLWVVGGRDGPGQMVHREGLSKQAVDGGVFLEVASGGPSRAGEC